MKTPAIAVLLLVLALVSLGLSGCESRAESHTRTKSSDPHEAAHTEAHGHPMHKILVTSAIEQDVTSTQQYVCQIHSCQHIEVCALEGGYLDGIHVKEGQAVKKGELMFKILPVLYQARMDSEIAEANRVQIELDNATNLFEKGIVSPQEIAIKKAELAKAKAKVELARAELSFTDVKAPFDGIVDRQRNQLGSLIEEGDVLTTFSDNSVMWVYFNVPEARYFEYQADLEAEAEEQARGEIKVVKSSQIKSGETKTPDDDDGDDDSDDDSDDDDDGDQDDSDDDDGVHDHLHVGLKLANGKIFPFPGKIGAIEADFNNTTGNIAFRADFPNPKGLLRNGQTGTILIHRELDDVIVIPQRATFEILANRYVYVVDEDNVVHQRDIKIASEQDDIFVIQEGLAEGEKIVLEGIRQVRDGDKVEYEFRDPEEVLSHLKYHAE